MTMKKVGRNRNQLKENLAGYAFVSPALITYILHAVTGIPELNAVLPAAGAVILVAISMVLTFVAGLIPSGVAAKKDPVIALRTE